MAAQTLDGIADELNRPGGIAIAAVDRAGKVGDQRPELVLALLLVLERLAQLDVGLHLLRHVGASAAIALEVPAQINERAARHLAPAQLAARRLIEVDEIAERSMLGESF